MSNAKPVGGRLCSTPFLIAVLIFIFSLYFMVKRFALGLGTVSNMNDGYPWGLWITYDVVIGTAFACGGYSMAILVYVLNKGKYHPLVRPALTASVFGYSLAGFSVFLDLGRYWQMHNIFRPSLINTNSVLFEVALCIAIYTLVLWIEFTPAFLEKFNKKVLHGRLEKIIFIFIALGVLLPTMHQSSLGSLMIAAGHKLSPLWWSPALPLLFLISSITMGYAVVLFESSITTSSFNLASEKKLLSKISAFIPWLIAIYLVIRVADLVIRGQLTAAFSGDLNGNMFLLENILLIVPMVMLLCDDCRQKAALLFFASIFLMLAGAVYRFNCFLVGFNPGDGWQYFPSFGEVIITFGIIAIEVAAYILFVKRLPILPSAIQDKG